MVPCHLVDAGHAAAGIDAAIAWGDIQAAGRRSGRPRPINDSWIAACCIARDLPLITLDVKDYLDFAEHEGLELIR